MYDTLIDIKFHNLKSASYIVKDSHPMLELFYKKILALDNFIMNDVPFDTMLLTCKNNTRTNLELLRKHFFELCCKYKINNPYMYNQYNKTPQYIDGKINPKLELQKVLEHLWGQGVVTIMSCEGHPEDDPSAMIEWETETAPYLLQYIRSCLNIKLIKEKDDLSTWPDDRIEWPTKRTLIRTLDKSFVDKLLAFEIDVSY